MPTINTLDADNAAKLGLLRELIGRWNAADLAEGGPDFPTCNALVPAIEGLAADLPPAVRKLDPAVAEHFGL
ncbi:MAG: hypothetical protein ING19_01450 [Azospirillum sp.]|nr:hypothetical protein [Azospirillum sp.]MCA3264707.1 hypothetical protein [Azospirillum sp.]